MATEVTCPDCKSGTIKPLDRCDKCGLSYEALRDAAAFLDRFSATENRKETP
jgi:uncharacterized protein (DUF983 family)